VGKIKSSKLDNGMVGLEITYGGPEAPFGGIDAKSGMYIDPLCFADAANFLIINQHLVALSWLPKTISLPSWPTGARYLDSGHFFQNGQYWNWSLAMLPGTPSGSPPSVTNTYYIWVWDPQQYGNAGTIAAPETTTITQTRGSVVGASATAVVTASGVSNAGSNGHASVDMIASSGGSSILTNYSFTTGATQAAIMSGLAGAINGNTSNPATAAVDPANSNQIILTAKAAGAAGNAIWVGSSSTIDGSTTGPIPIISVSRSFSGGGAGGTFTGAIGLGPWPVSYTSVGEVLYIGGFGTVILQYTRAEGVVSFGQLTDYLGAVTLGKFNSSLIAVGMVPGPGAVAQGVIQAPEMIIAWSAAGKPGVWNPLNGDGTVTGAGWNRPADICDYLTGMFITPGQAIILKTQGIDYITPLSSGPSPFDFAHISNALVGEGCQDMRLRCQYDQIGMFIGNTNVFQFSGGIQAVGDKIKDKLLAEAQYVGGDSRDSCAGTIFQDVGTNKAQTIFMFMIKSNVYIYNINNGTWMLFPLPYNTGLDYDLEILCYSVGTNPQAPNYQFVATFNPFLIIDDSTPGPPSYYGLEPWIQAADFAYAQPSFVLWPKEEIEFGRDITIDGLLVNCWGTPGLVLNWSVSGILSGTLTLPTGADQGFANYQVYFSNASGGSGASGAGVTTIQNPQLRLDIPVQPSGVRNQVAFAKLAMFGSFDPNQRPI